MANSTLSYSRQALLALMAFAAALTHPFPSIAGEADPEPDDTHLYGAPYFGEAKIVPTLDAVPEVRIKGQQKGTPRFFITVTDDHGRFRREGLGLEVDADSIVFTCEKSGYKTIEVMTRRMSNAKDAAVEVECLMVKNPS